MNTKMKLGHEHPGYSVVPVNQQHQNAGALVDIFRRFICNHFGGDSSCTKSEKKKRPFQGDYL